MVCTGEWVGDLGTRAFGVNFVDARRDSLG